MSDIFYDDNELRKLEFHKLAVKTKELLRSCGFEDITDMTAGHIAIWIQGLNHEAYNKGCAAQHAKDFDEMAESDTWHERQLRETELRAQTNAVAWTIGIIDTLHIEEGTDFGIDNDMIYKGIKNTVRDRYKAEIGVDPAPNYPIRAILITGKLAEKGKRTT